MNATSTSAGADERRVGGPSTALRLPEGLFVSERPPAGGPGGVAAPVVVFVHGSLDRASSFARVARRLDDVIAVTYDRRGYQGSRGAAVSDDLAAHIDDLVAVATAYAEHLPESPGIVAIGHSVGATIVLGAAVRTPHVFCAVGAYEPSMPWLGFHRKGTAGSRAVQQREADPGVEAERFFRRMVGDAAWERLPEDQREGRRLDGPALLADLRAIRRPAPFDVTALSVPTVVSSGGPASHAHHLDTADWLEHHVQAVRRSTIPDAAHGAHLSHPDAFAAFVREVVALGGCTSRPSAA